MLIYLFQTVLIIFTYLSAHCPDHAAVHVLFENTQRLGRVRSLGQKSWPSSISDFSDCLQQ